MDDIKQKLIKHLLAEAIKGGKHESAVSLLGNGEGSPHADEVKDNDTVEEPGDSAAGLDADDDDKDEDAEANRKALLEAFLSHEG